MTRSVLSRFVLHWPQLLPQAPTRRAHVQPQRSRRQSARMAVGIGAATLLMATVGMSLALETVRPDWRDPDFGHRLHRLQHRLQHAPDRPLVLMLGTSRTQYGVCPSAMGFPDEAGHPLIFNFGQSAAPPLKVMLTLHRVLEAGITPSAVVIEVLPVWLASHGPAVEQLGRRIVNFSARDVAHLAADAEKPGELWQGWATARAAPWYSSRLILMSHWQPRWVPWVSRVDSYWTSMQEDGFIPFPYEDPPESVRATATTHAQRELAAALPGFSFGDVSVRALEQLVTQCRNRGIRVAFQVPPVSSGLRNWFGPGVWASGDEQFQKLALQLGVEVFPARELPESDFVDGHHMVPRAAKSYSRWLAETHLQYWLRR